MTEQTNVDNLHLPFVRDEQLVDYILRHLPESEHESLSERLAHDAALQTRLAAWESVLFSLHDQTEPVTPSPAVWENIERKLFPETAVAADKQTSKRGFGRYLMPAFFSLCVLFAGSYFFAHQPTYGVSVLAANSQPAWEVTGNESHITFVSVTDVSMPNMDCMAWVDNGQGKLIKLGRIPDTGKGQKKRMLLPDSLPIQSGDKIVIIMVDKDYRGALPPASARMMNKVTLTEI